MTPQSRKSSAPEPRYRTPDPVNVPGAWFDEAAVEKVRKFGRLCRHTKGRWDGCPIEFDPWQVAHILEPIFGWKHPDGRRIRRTGYIEVPKKTGKSTTSSVLGLYLTGPDDEPGAEVYCVGPSMRVLCADLQWRPAGMLEVGDSIVAFDEHPPQPHTYRKMRNAVVSEVGRAVLPSYRIGFADGREVIASSEHRWLTRSHPLCGSWIETKLLAPGSLVRDLGEPWRPVSDWDAGYLAGVFDGEGSLHGRGPRAGWRIAFGQRPGVVMDLVRELLKAYGFDISAIRTHASGVDSFEIRGLYDCLRFLGQTQPQRLLAKVPDWIEGRSPSRTPFLEVISVEDIGPQEVVTLATSTRTLFVEGLFSHNSAACEKDQARLVFDPSRLMVERSPALRARYTVYRNSIVYKKTASSFKVISSAPDGKHGLNIHGGIVDELHAHRDRELVDTLDYGTASREQPLMIYITTAGEEDDESIYAEKHDYAISLAEGRIDDPTFYGVIYCAEPDDDPFDEKTWEKAIPSLDVTVSRDYLRSKAVEAAVSPAKLKAFRRFHLNVRESSSVKILPLSKWDATAGDVIDESKLADERCHGGLDVGRSQDVAAFVLDFPHDGDEHDVLFRFWLPEEFFALVDEETKGAASKWLAAGDIRLTPGDVIDYDAIEKQILEDAKTFDLIEIGFNRRGARQLANRLESEGGITMVQMAPGITLAPATQEWLRLIGKKTYRHGGNLVARSMVDKLVARMDTEGNAWPDKGKSRGNIAGCVAAVLALDSVMNTPEPIVYETGSY